MTNKTKGLNKIISVLKQFNINYSLLSAETMYKNQVVRGNALQIGKHYFTAYNGMILVNKENDGLYKNVCKNQKVALCYIFGYNNVLPNNYITVDIDDYTGDILGYNVQKEETQEPTQAIEKVACEVEPTIKEETQEPTKKAQTKKVVEVIKNQLSNIKEVTTKNEHYYKIHLNNNYMITAFYSNCAKCYKVTLFDMSKSPKNGENKVVHTLKLQDLTNFKEVYNFCQIVEKQIQEQPTTKESCKTVESTTTTIKEETQEQPTFEEKREYQKTHMELIYNIIINNTEGFNKEYKNRAITRLYKYTDDMYTARFTLSYFYHDEKEKWMFTLKNHDGVLLNYNIHKSLLNEKWLLDLCKQVNDIINESK